MSEPRRGRRVVRAPNHLGEVVMSLPALAEAAEEARRSSGKPLLVQVVSGLCPILQMARLDAEIIPLEDRRAVLRGAAELRRRGAARGVLLTPAISAAVIFLLAGVASRRGVSVRGRSWMLTEAVDREPLLTGHRVLEYMHLVGPGRTPSDPPPPRLACSDEARRAWRALGERLGLGAAAGSTVALFPGANASSRRWPTERFTRLAGWLAREGHRVLVLGGPGERQLTARVADGGAAGAGEIWDLGGRTTLEELVGALCACDVLVTNDTGPMHVAAALDRPIVALEGAADLRQTRPLGSRVRIVGHFELSCVPCVKNECPRTGRGFALPEAERECMRLITVDAVHEAVASLLERST
ncbi:MAG: glycosyltransferase family 9 protein [Gemmatimonadota bacterium]